ncbi:MAG: carboxypeptidase regulatory-like domain-containing protein [Vicinamibacterales bacterium]
MSSRFHPAWSRWRIVAVIALLHLPTGAAIAGQQDSSIIGQVSDESGGVLPGVTITAASPALQTGQQIAVTDERGQYRITPLPIGVYDVTYALQGFRSVKREGIRLTVGFNATVNVALGLGGLEETVIVSGASPVVDLKSTVTSTVMTRETLELLPTSRNSVVGLMQQAPGARPNIDVAGSSMNEVPSFRAFGIAGESWQAVENVPTSNGRTNNGSGTFWDYAAIEEAKVGTLAHSAEVPLIGVHINAIVKSGGNDFHGQLFSSTTSDKFQSKNIDDDLRAQGITEGGALRYRREIQGELSGRLIRDKLWFYGSARRRSNSDTIPGVFKPDGTIASIDDTQRYTTWKLSYQAGKSNKIEAFDTWLFKTQDGRELSILNQWDSRILQKTPNHVGRIGWSGIKGNNISSTVQFGYWWNASQFTGYTNEPSATDQITLLNWGLHSSGNEETLSKRLTTRGTVDYFKPEFLGGDHSFRFGGEHSWAVGDRYRNDRGAAGNYQRIFRDGVPFQIGVWNAPTRPQTPGEHLAFFLQDSWNLSRALTLNLGVRYAYDKGVIPRQCREAAPEPFAVLAPAGCFDAVPFANWHSFSPRLNLAYTLGAKTVIKGGWNRFSSMRSTDTMTNANQNASTTTVFTWRDTNGNKLYDPGEVDLRLDGPDFVSRTFQGVGSGLANAVPNPNEKQPYQDQYVLGIEREVLPLLALRLTGVHVRSYRQNVVTNLLRPYDVYTIPITNMDPGVDGRLGTADDTGTSVTYYDYPAQYRGLSFQQPTLVNSGLVPTYSSFEVAGSKRYADGWQFMASYTATKSNVPIITNVTSPVAYTDDPNAEIFARNNTWEWLARLSGSYMFPYRLQFSTNFEHRSGTPFARTVSFRGGVQIPSITLRVEEIGARRTPNINLLDMRLEKSFAMGGSRRRVSLRLNVYNVMNANTPTAITQQSGARFGFATAILSPRVAEVGATYSF